MLSQFCDRFDGLVRRHGSTPYGGDAWAIEPITDRVVIDRSPAAADYVAFHAPNIDVWGVALAAQRKLLR
jgi:hypothetical protein